MSKNDKVLNRLYCIQDHIYSAIQFRVDFNSKFRVKRELLSVREDIIKAINILNKELKEEIK